MMCVAHNRANLLLKIESTHLPTGPYAIRPSTGEIICVSRLYEDDCSAFIGGAFTFNAQLQCFHWLMTGVIKPDSTMVDSLTFIRIV